MLPIPYTSLCPYVRSNLIEIRVNFLENGALSQSMIFFFSTYFCMQNCQVVACNARFETHCIIPLIFTHNKCLRNLRKMNYCATRWLQALLTICRKVPSFTCHQAVDGREIVHFHGAQSWMVAAGDWASRMATFKVSFFLGTCSMEHFNSFMSRILYSDVVLQPRTGVGGALKRVVHAC